jgi:tyrosyl-tRNA synthetase
MQGYDSVMVRADIELGGMDQKFNVLVGRDLQQAAGQDAQVGLFMPILLGTDGKEKMSKSLGNYIGITEPAQSMFHKLINIPDHIVANYYELLTDVPAGEIKARESDVRAGRLDPREWKARLARAITAQYHGEKKALEAEAEEKKIHAGDTIPENTPVFEVSEKSINVVDLLCQCKLFSSKSEARRMILNGGVSIDQQKVADPKAQIAIHDNMVVRVGKRQFVKIRKKG